MGSSAVQFRIVTPSFNGLGFLKRCVASVADQTGEGPGLPGAGAGESPGVKGDSPRTDGAVYVHHHVQDARSTDGTIEFGEGCRADGFGHAFSFASEPDGGMYEALNRGFGAAEGMDVVAWLNADEQYLPHTLRKVAAFFASRPGVDVVFGGALVVDDEGRLLACRKAMPMRRAFLEASYLYNLSCATFWRAGRWRALGGFDLAFRNAGDEELMRRAMAAGVRTATMPEYLATFVYGADNLSSGGTALEEHERLKRSARRWTRALKLPLNLLRLAEKGVRGGSVEKGPLAYEIFADSERRRTRFVVERPSCRWPDAGRPYLLRHRLAEERRRGAEGGEATGCR